VDDDHANALALAAAIARQGGGTASRRRRAWGGNLLGAVTHIAHDRWGYRGRSRRSDPFFRGGSPRNVSAKTS
jgi:hypothetical protein